MISSTPLRKSYNRRLNESISCTPVEPVVNDDSERRNRRSVYDVERRLLNISESNNSAAPADIDQMKNHIMMCQKLFVENKISIRNAWDIKVIEYIHHYVSSIRIDSESLVVAAMTLDVCVKVHGCRIEYIGQEINKLVTTQAATALEQGDNATEEEMCDEANNDRNSKNKRKKKRIVATVAKDSSVFCSDISKIASTHFTGNIDIYANNFENMFTKKMPMDHSAYKYNLLQNRVCGFLSYDTKDIPIQKKLIPVTNSKITYFAICPEFKNFNVDENDPDSNNSIVDMMTDNNASRIHELIADEVVYDEHGAPVPELDGFTHDIFADDNEIDDMVEEIQPVEQAAPNRVEMITSFCPSEKSAQRSDLARSTLSQNFLETIWVGPSHWKNKLIRPSAPRYSGKSEEKVPQLKPKKKTVRPKPTPINFDDPFEIDFTKKCITKRISYNIKKVTLPPNIISVIPDCDKLILRDLRPTKEYCAPRRESEYEHSPYDYDNPDDSQYCSQIELPNTSDNHQDQENMSLDAIGEDIVEEVICANARDNQDMTGNLIDLPDMVTQTYIPYAARAKRLNMKKVKNAILNCLTKVTVSSENKMDIESFEPTSLSSIYKMLPAKLSNKDRREISIHQTFFCLLHLTNDNNLSLSGSENLNDVMISKT